jgi:diacylglycerol diphosphate phosphatase / phosphatidate phosphatase
MFYLDNIAIQFPHAEVERVPVSWLFLYALAAPLIALLVWIVTTVPGWHKAHVTLLGLFTSIVLTLFITDLIKNAVGRPRPDLLARCKAKAGTPKHELVSFDICTETDHHLLHDGWRSFPSGHSSFAFSGLGYLAIVLAGQLQTLRPRTDLTRVLLTIVPLLAATLIAISRCEDYRHDVYDVTVGSMLGLAVAYTTYRRYYPALMSRKCDVPYAVQKDAGSGYTRPRDEEQGLTSDEGESEGERISLQDLPRTKNRPDD